jgi:iron complex outermembrane receptor protein
LFHLDITDELVPFEVPAFPGRTFFANAGESTRRGVEAGLQWQNDSGISAGLSITYSDFLFDRFEEDSGADFSGNRLPGVPRRLAYASIAFDRGAGWFGLAEVTYAGGFFADNANSVKTESYVLSNLRLGHRFERGRWQSNVFLGINNLLDEVYYDNVRPNAFGGRYFEPAPPRNAYAGFALRF